LTYPITPQQWHFRQSIDYSISANRAVLDFASKWREAVLFNVYQMGRNAISRGSTDYWTPAPHRYAAVAQKLGVPMTGTGGGRGGAAAVNTVDRDAAVMAELRKPESRDPRGFVIPSGQPDFPTAVKFVNALREVGISVQRATREFEVQGRKYPAGSFVVMSAQAFRPHVIDMFEPQDHPDNIPYPGAAPTPPYDHAGWTLAFQMGVEFDRILEPFTGPFQPVTDWNVKPPPGTVTAVSSPAGYVISHQLVDSFVALNRLLAAGEEGYWLPDGRWYITARPSTRAALEKTAADLGVGAQATTEKPSASALRLRPPRVGLWDQYGGSMDSGWARWILEQYGFNFEKVFAPALDAGNLNAKYDALVFVEGGIPAADGGGGGAQPAPADIPAEYRSMLGRVSVARTIPELRRFVENGGTVLAIGASATNLARHFSLAIDDHLVENGKPLPESKFYTPGSVLTARVDTAHPLAHGMKERTDLFFDNSPVFSLGPNASSQGVKAVVWFDTATPLKSGWSWGQQYLQNGVAVIDAPLGKGHVYLFGPEIIKRAQPHATFKFLFNGLYHAAAARSTSPSSAPR
jgi:hypothetical protein